jgi:hypothetical protein
MSLLADIAKQGGMHIARRTVANRYPAYSKRRNHEADAEASCPTLHAAAGLARPALPDASQPVEACPIWFAALMATSCLSGPNGENRALRWDGASGRALYTNRGGDAEHIEPLGVRLLGGQTLAVYWMPGETAYTVEVYRQNDRCA